MSQISETLLKDFVRLVRQTFNTEEFIPLHAPVFHGNEKKYVLDCIESTFVSSVGKYVNTFEEMMAKLCGVKHAIAVVNGTEALHIALKLAGVETGDEVITQPLTFVATCNAISYCNAMPSFVDVDSSTMGMSAEALSSYLKQNAVINGQNCFNKVTKKRIGACVPVHIFGHPLDIKAIKSVCDDWKIPVVEDAAEGLGSYLRGQHVGGDGLLSTFSFNGNKIATAGGGGAIVTNDEGLAKRAKHLTTTAKVPHAWEYVHDEIGYNYRMPNINAALICAQLEQLESFLTSKRNLAKIYESFFRGTPIEFAVEPPQSQSNYWLNTIKLPTRKARDEFLEYTNKNGIMTRPAWRLMNELSMFKHAHKGPLDNAIQLEDRLVNIPSSVIPKP